MSQPLGQHFLKDTSVLKKITDTLNLSAEKYAIEIGPGHGELTEKIINKIEKRKDIKIISIEKDKNLAEELRQKFRNYTNVEIVEGDALKLLSTLSYKLKPESYILVGNIPYYITGFLFRTIGELKHKPTKIIFMIQKEVAERIVAKPPHMNRLAASVQFWGKPKIISTIPPTSFSPPPNVYSALIYLDTFIQNEVDPSVFFETVKALFQQPRKTILNNLTSLERKEKVLEILKKEGLDPNLRPQNLKIEQILNLAGKFKEKTRN